MLLLYRINDTDDHFLFEISLKLGNFLCLLLEWSSILFYVLFQLQAGKTPAELAVEGENDLAAKMLLKKENVLSWREKLKTLKENTCPSPASFRSSMSSIISRMSVVLISSDEETDDETFIQTEDPDDLDY